MRIHWWLTEELPTSVCGRNVQCDEWFSLEPRCKDSANRVECKKRNSFFFSFPRCRLSWTPVQRYEEKQSVVPLFPRLVTTFPTACYISLCISWLQSQILKYKSWWLSYIAEYKEDRWSTILLLTWNCGRIMGWMLGAVKKRAENGIFQWNAKNGNNK